MQEYYILTLNSGQPIILYKEADKVYMYTTLSGRIRSQGVVFDEVAGEICLLTTKHQYVSYISTNGQVKLFVLEDMRFVEIISLPLENLSHSEVTQISLNTFHGEAVLFYLMHNSEDSTNALFYVCENSINKSNLVSRENYSYEQFGICALENEMLICLYGKNKRKLFSMDSDKRIQKITGSDISTDKLKKEIISLTDKLNSQKKNAEDAENTLSRREQEITNYKTSIETMKQEMKTKEKEIEAKENEIKTQEKEIQDSNRKIYELENEISGLKSTQQHITKQYNELADFAGELQEELRKVRYL